MNGGIRAEVMQERLSEDIEDILLEQSSEIVQLSRENEDNLLRILIAIGGIVSSLGTLVAGLFALTLAKRIFDRGVEATAQAEAKARDTAIQQARAAMAKRKVPPAPTPPTAPSAKTAATDSGTS